ncbi:MAG TPA: ABC-F family ATP-binding cassette domain-containing protein [Bacteroidales bacterium]|nr:ABC-F family ATP-binding cassette domain-containing protein [Bacteroidales bacterium]HRR49039.1 ABC-F family ATP-binding cassette domain-containing protein [Bacteroidales bacterium]HRT33399.1 ABC-F family ATP-binding cassette domain-containing protein [Bacteroidales bacterium]HRT83173.1 ABC-F family ATP-binding cassette domain-containing protein [Bacteroidales bacterium]
MATILQAENISKSYGTRILFNNLEININEGDRIALIAPNGSGKSTLLRILAGKDSSDIGGSVRCRESVKIAWLEQDPSLNPERDVFEEVFASSDELSKTVEEYERAILSNNTDIIGSAIREMDRLNGWQYELKVKQILSLLKIDNLNQKVATLSGGQRKRVAIAGIMLANADLLVLDEPTNHLDLEVIEYLEEYLCKPSLSLLMVTHDRYFLDRVCTQIMELDNGQLYRYQGNYSYYLQKKEERIENFNSETDRARNLFRKELEWIRRMPQARATKAKYRINAFEQIKERALQKKVNHKIAIDVKSERLGSKIINCKGVTHHFGDYCTIDNFSYNFAKGEKVGLVGPNGVGKTTFLNIISELIPPQSGIIETGETVVKGYYKQSGLEYTPEETVIDVVRKYSEIATLSDGSIIPVTQFLSKFLFPYSCHNTPVSRLSGGERRRLYLVTILMKNPNFLILDEPTNDLDIITLNVLEDYLSDFKGCLIIVSHDRFFLDKLADHLFVFMGNGIIKDFPGNYSDYKEYCRNLEKEKNTTSKKIEERKQPSLKKANNKYSYKEKFEITTLETEINLLEKEKAEIEEILSTGHLSQKELTEKSKRIGEIISLIDQKSDRWIELNS